MNCITNFDCDYVSQHGIIENVNIISVTDDDCALNIISNQTIIRTSIDNVRIIIKSHERILKIDQIIDLNENLILSIDGYKCMVNAVNRYDDDTVDVVGRFGLLFDNETTKRVSIDNLMICGHYESVKGLRSVAMAMPFEYSRYFNNVSIFRSILSRGMGAAMVCWDAEHCELRVFALNESDINRIEFVVPVFASQLSLLIGGRPSRPLEMLASLRVWEYQYESELEANIAIGPQGSHIIAVRALRGIAGVVLTKSNRLRLIAENKAALREARSLLEIRRDTYLFDDSFIPILIGKSASRISELVAKSGLHCIHVPNTPCSVHLNDHVSLIDRSISKKRELSLYGTRESIASARLLLEVEESVRDLKKEFEQSRNTRRKLRQSQFSLKSSSTSSIVSKESRNNKTTRENEDEEGGEGEGEEEEEREEKDNDDEENEDEPDPLEEDVFERALNTVIVSDSQPLSWADARDDDDPKSVSGGGGGDNGADSSGVYTDFFSSSNATSTRPTRPRQSAPPNRMMAPQQSGQRRPRVYPRKQFGLLFTNSALCGNTLDDRIDQQLPPQSQLPSHRNRPHGMGPGNHGNSNNNRMGGGGWGQNQSGFRPKPSIDRRVPHQHSHHQQHYQQQQSQSSYHQKQRRSSPTGGDHGNSGTM